MQRSFVVLENSVYPFLLSHNIVRFISVDEFSVSLALHEVALSTQTIFLLEEMSMFHVHVPSAFVYLFAGFVYVSSVAVLLAITEGTFKGITICVGYSSLSVNLVIVEAANVLEGISAFAESQPALTFFLASHEFSLINITVSVFQHSFSVEFSTLELTLVGLILVYILPSSDLLIFSKLSLVNSSISLFEHPMSLLLIMHKMSFVLCICLEVLQFPKSVELICVELSFVLRHSLQEVLSLALLHALQETSLVPHAGIRLESSSLEVIILKLSRKLIAIGKVKLAVAAVLLAIDHRALELGAIHICNFSHRELTLCKNALKGSVGSFSPHSLAVWFVLLVEVALVVIAIFEGQFSVLASACFELSLEQGLIRGVEHLALAVRSAEVVALSLVMPLPLLLLSYRLRLQIRQFLSHRQNNKYKSGRGVRRSRRCTLLKVLLEDLTLALASKDAMLLNSAVAHPQEGTSDY